MRNDNENSNNFIISLKNRFATLQDTEAETSATDRYKNFETACKEAAIEHIPAKERTKKRKSWESEEVGKMRKVVQEAAKERNTNPNVENTAKFKTAQTQLTETYFPEPLTLH